MGDVIDATQRLGKRSIGMRLRLARLERGLSFEKLADRSGIAPGRIAAYESGRSCSVPLDTPRTRHGWLSHGGSRYEQLDARYDDAENTLRRALDLDSQNALVHFHLALVYLQKEDRASAFDHLVLARDLGSVEAEALLAQYFP